MLVGIDGDHAELCSIVPRKSMSRGAPCRILNDGVDDATAPSVYSCVRRNIIITWRVATQLAHLMSRFWLAGEKG